MKISISKTAKTMGSVLMISLGAAFVIGMTLASYLVLVHHQSTSVTRSQTWNHSIAVTEAGVEDALQFLNKYAGGPNLSSWTNSSSCQEDNWTQVSASVYHVRRYLAAKVYYDVYITNMGSSASIYSLGYVPGPYAGSAPNVMFASAGVGQPSVLARKIYVETKIAPLFNFALAAIRDINLDGFNVRTDSFDSTDPAYSTSGRYDPNKNKHNGDVFTNSSLTNTLDVGNAKVMGKVKTGPGNNTIKIGPNGSVGSESWVEGGKTGIESGWSSTDMNVEFKDVPLPTGVMWLPLPTTPTIINGITYDHVIVTPGYYQTTSLTKSVYVATNVNAVLHVQGNTSLSGQDRITIAAGGSSLMIYSGGSFSTSGNAEINNLSQNAANLTILGLPTCTSIDITGNAAVTGVVYAPQANVKIGGGGADTYDFVGSVLGRNVRMNGKMNFHYDENLKRVGWGRGYVPTVWKEL
jgi:hypothetical protein